jgi:hypothetical protein
MMVVFLDAVPCSLVEIFQRFRVSYRFHYQGDVSEMLTASIIKAMTMQAASTFETSVSFYETPRHNIPEDSGVSKLSAVRTRNLSYKFTIKIHKTVS